MYQSLGKPAKEGKGKEYKDNSQEGDKFSRCSKFCAISLQLKIPENVVIVLIFTANSSALLKC
jgi:hypothetical protein